MVELIINQDEDIDITLTPVTSPVVGSTVRWVMLTRETKSTTIEKWQITPSGVTSITIPILSSDTAKPVYLSANMKQKLWPEEIR